MSKALFAISAAAFTLAGCTSVGQVPTARLASGTFHTANGAPVGTVLLLAAGSEVSINVAVAGLPQGTHGIHLHMVGSCDAPGFTSAGGHLNPHDMQHGSANPAGSHLGDLPNLTVGSSGTGTLSATLRDDRVASMAELFDGDGTAVVIHADPDDYKTDPSGNSGTRIACAVLKRTD